MAHYLLSLPGPVSPPRRLVLLAYSYGSCVAAHMLEGLGHEVGE